MKVLPKSLMDELTRYLTDPELDFVEWNEGLYMDEKAINLKFRKKPSIEGIKKAIHEEIVSHERRIAELKQRLEWVGLPLPEGEMVVDAAIYRFAYEGPVVKMPPEA